MSINGPKEVDRYDSKIEPRQEAHPSENRRWSEAHREEQINLLGVVG